MQTTKNAALKGREFLQDTTANELIAFLNDTNVEYEVIKNIDALMLAGELGLEYPFNPNLISPILYTGKFDGEDITCFISILDGQFVWAIYGTIDDAFMANDCDPSFCGEDKAVMVK